MCTFTTAVSIFDISFYQAQFIDLCIDFFYTRLFISPWNILKIRNK